MTVLVGDRWYWPSEIYRTGATAGVSRVAEFMQRSRYNPNSYRDRLPADSGTSRPQLPSRRQRTARRGACMATCPECDAEIEVDEFDVDKGDQLSCPECGSNLEVTGLVAARARPRADEDDEDDDEDDDDEDEDDDDATTTRTRTTTRRTRTSTSERPRLASAEGRRRCRETALALARIRRDRRLQRRRRQRLSRLRRQPHARRPRASRSPPTARAIRSATAAWRSQIAAQFGLQPRDHPDRASSSARSTAPTRQPLLLLQARALHASVAHRARARRRRSSTAATPTIAATIGPGRQAAREFGVRSPLDEVGSDQGRNPRAVAARRPADVGRAGVGLPVVAHSVPHRSHRREAAHDRARRAGAARARLPRLPRAASRRARARRDRARRDAARARARRQPRDRARAEGARLPATSRSICRATAPAA